MQRSSDSDFDCLVNRPVLQAEEVPSSSSERSGGGGGGGKVTRQRREEGGVVAKMDFEEDVDDDDDVLEEQEEEASCGGEYGHYFLPQDVSRRWSAMDSGDGSGKKVETIPRPRIAVEAEDSEFQRWKRTSAAGSGSKARPPFPLPVHHHAGTLDRRTANACKENVYDDGCTHYYASAATLQRDRQQQKVGTLPRTPADVYLNYLKRVQASAEADPMDLYSRTMSSYFYESSRKNSARRRLEGIAAAIGFVGIVLSIALLLAYLAVQAPQLRKAIGPFYATEHHRTSEDKSEGRMLRLEPQTPNVFYAMELACSMFASLMMILTNSLLIHGVRKKSAAFLLPWLIFHCFIIVGILVSTALILVYVEPAAFKAISLVPFVAAVLLTLCWIKVFKLHQTAKKAFTVGRRFRYQNFSGMDNPYAVPVRRGHKSPEPDVYY